MRIFLKGFLSILIAFFACLSSGNAQIRIEYTHPTAPDVLQVCGLAEFQVHLTQNGPDTLRDVELQLAFPNGVAYVLSTVQNAQEKDISDPQRPLFELPLLAPANRYSISLQMEAQCELVDQINNGILFANDITVNYAGGSNSIRTSNYDIETPLLVVVGSTGLSQSGSRGEILERSFRIRNTRFGRLSSFVFKDAFPDGLSVSASPGVDTSTIDGRLAVVLDGDDFQTIGDGDAFFEQNETIVITERVLVEDCGLSGELLISSVQLCWGCSGEICQQTTPVEAVVEAEPSELFPDLVFRPIIRAPECFCPNGSAEQEIWICNKGNEPARDIVITIDQNTFIGGLFESGFSLDSMGRITQLTPVLGEPLPVACSPEQLFRQAAVPLPDLAEGDSVRLFWTDVQCAEECARLYTNRWSYSYGYNRSCPPDQFINDSNIGLEIESNFDNFLTNLGILDTQTNVFSYSLSSELLASDDGQLELVVEIPCFADYSSNDFALGGQLPDEVSINSADSSDLVTISYSLPLPADSVNMLLSLFFDCFQGCDSLFCNQTLATTCRDACSLSGTKVPGIVISATINTNADCPDECGAQTCSRGEIQYPCILPPCRDSIPGYVNFNFEIFRLNTGLADNDDDRLPDAAGQIDLSKIRRDRAIAGDTIRFFFDGEVKVDIEGFDFRQMELATRFLVLEQLGSGSKSSAFAEDSWRLLGNRIRIYDQSENRYFNCSDLPLTVDGSPSLGTFDVNAVISADSLMGSMCNLPADFVFQQGDSIYLEADLRIEENLFKQDSTQTRPDIIKMVMEPNIRLFNTGAESYRNFSCDCLLPTIEVSGYCVNLAPGVYPIPPCESSAYTSGSFFQILLGEDNFFPFEYRKLAQLQRLFVKLPSSHQLTEARLLYLQLQDQTSLLLDRMIDADFQGGNWELDLTEVMQTQEIDEGFTYLFQFRFDADCDVTSNAPIGVDSRVLFSPNLPEIPNSLDTGVVNPVGLRSLVSRLRLDVPLANNTSLDDKGRWALELFNDPLRIASTESGALENCWMEVQSGSGAVSNFRLIDQNTGQVISPVNGLFQLGQLNPRDTLQLLLIGDNRSCIREEILLRYGWNCTPYVNRIQPACFERTQQLTLISPPAELEQLVISPSGPFNLCDTIDYHIIELFNADLGRAYDILTEVRLPPGLSILPGSSQLAYPFDQAYEPIADPIDLGGGQWQWNLSTLNDSIGLNGLPGSNLEPANKARLRFQLITDCDFISNSELIAVVRANQNCDQAANTLAESSASIEVVGVDEPYTTDISVSPLLTVGCEDEEMLELTINPNGTTSAADSLFLSLPPGISYIPFSYQALENAPVDGPSIANQGSFDQLRWRIPTGITSSQSIRFRIGIEGLQSLDCGQQLMNIQTLAPANALCAADGQSCDILVETGSSLYAFQVDRPVLEAFDFSVQAEADGSEYLLFYELSVRNGGPQTTLPTYVDLYIDADGDGLLSAGDQLVALDSITANISTGASRLIGGAFRLTDIDQICQFIAVIDPLKHCACRTVGASIRQPIEIRRPDLTALCSGEPAQLGIDSAEQTLYQWEPADFLDCALCPQTTFLYENLSGQPQQLEYLLRQEDSSGCLINNLFSVIVQPEPAILNSSDILCLGSEITLEATPAVTYNWQGPGIVNPRLSTQTVQPTEDALYIVNITDSVGCMGTDSLLVLVRPLPGVDAGPDTTVCENAVIQLDASEVDGYSYQWSPAGLLNNPTIPNPLLLQNETTVFRLTVTDQNGCIGFDSVRVAFSEPPNLQFSAIDPLCEGEEVVLEVSGAQTYDWSPEEGLSCTDCPSVVASPMETTVYTVVGTDAEGCSNSLAIRVEVLAASNSQTQQGACEGEVVEIFGQSIEQSGLYCDTLSSVLTGCDSISCIDLSFNPRPETSSEAILCEGDTLAFAGELYTQSGLYCGDFQTAAGCDSTHCVAVEVVEGPQIIFDESVEGFRGTDIPLMLPTGFDYQWRPATYLSCTDCSNPVASIPLDEPSDELVYDILFSDDNNCQARGRLRILLLDPVCQEPFIFVPNAFTPNEDGENDFFQVYGAAIESMHLMIYDRWGRKVFETRDPQAQWDGTFNGQKLYSESFGYYLEVDCVGGDRFLKKGNVTLIR